MSDPRFSRLRTDPRFKRPRKDQNKIVVDERFKSIFQDDDALGKKGKGKSKQPRIDKYGRPVSRTKDREDLRKFYRMEDDDDDAEPEAGPSTNKSGPRRHVDLARGEVLLESSSEEDSDEDDGGVVSLGPETYKLAPSATKKRHTHAEDDLEIDLDESQFAELDAEAAEAAKDDDDDQRRTTAKGDETARLAVVNLDWDHVRASDLFRVFSSTATLIDEGGGGSGDGEATTKPRKRSRPSKETPTTTTTTRVLRVRIYPSEFGKSRMEKEDLEGPPPEIFADKKKKKNAMMPTILLSRRQRENIAAKEEEFLGMNPDDVNEKTIYHQEDADQFDQEALRKYQLERLRYFYAVVECDSPQTAAFIYTELDGTELERTANLFDLSYIPADMTFEEEFRDEATQDLGNHKPLEFATDALRSSKVKLTWDDDDQDRIELTRRPLTQKEIDENDFGKYLAASSDEESEPELEADATAENSKAAKRAADRARLRGLLLGEGGVGKDDDDFFTYDDGKNRAGDMEITFTPGLSMSAKKEEEEETTLDLYKKKMKEKKQARMSKWEEKKDVWRKRQSGEAASDEEEAAGGGGGHNGDTFFEARDEADEEEAAPPPRKKPSTAAELALLAADLEPADGAQHFDMAKVLKAEKKSTKKKKIRKRRGKGEDENVDQEDEREDGRGFEIDVQDDRFKALHDEYEFAIDPSNPHYKKTKAMNQLLDERRKRLKDKVKEEVEQRNARKLAKEAEADGPDLNKLVQSVKRKSESAAKSTSEHRGKRSKLA